MATADAFASADVSVAAPTEAATIDYPEGALALRVAYPSPTLLASAAVAALAGTVMWLPALLVVAFFVRPVVALAAWIAWVGLGAVASISRIRNLLARTLGDRAPRPHELDPLRHALVRACGAACVAPDDLTLRIAPGRMNAYSGADIIAVTADMISGRTALEEVELEAVIAHELGHFRHRDGLLAGAIWWYLLPLRLVEILSRVPFIGPVLMFIPLVVVRALLIPVGVLWRVSSTRREFLADRFAADCGYAVPLERVFRRLSQYEGEAGSSVLAVLTASHPPFADRVSRLADTISNDADAYGLEHLRFSKETG